MPRALARLGILASTSAAGCCPQCGKPWVRVVAKGESTYAKIKATGHDWAAMQAQATLNGTALKAGQVATGSTRLPNGTQPHLDRAAVTFLGWVPGCKCGAPAGWRDDDLELIATPTGERAGEDPSLVTGRNGYNRPRGDNEGRRPITRYEQRQYAAQLRNSPHRAAVATMAGTAFAHYIRTDRSGARPLPPELLAELIERGWLERVTVPTWTPLAPVPCLVLDPFSGSGTTVAEAKACGRDGHGIDLSEQYLCLAQDRLAGVTAPLVPVGYEDNAPSPTNGAGAHEQAELFA
jgi:hypothetical protein